MTGKVTSSKMLVVLLSVCLISAALLSYVHIITYERIKHNRQQRLKNAVFKVIPGIDSYSRINIEQDIFKGSADGVIVGYAVLSEGVGFQGNIGIIVGFDKEIKFITGVSILESVETPGLGGKIREDDFLNQFKNLLIPADKKIVVDTITGATISSRAVEKIINNAIKDVKDIY